jgi:hypothetical protein
MGAEKLAKIILVLLLLATIVAYLLARDAATTCRQCGMANPILRPRLEIKEPFQNPVRDGPAATDASYLLLTDILPAAEAGAAANSPTSQRCWEEDFQKRLEKTGNFKQMTNNYKRGTPDSCSAPLHDLTTTFYEVEPLDGA